MTVSETKIECRDIWKVFGDDAAAFCAASPTPPTTEALTERGFIAGVREATFSVKSAETFVIMGLSGSGKSTLVRCLSRLIEPTAGAVLFEGQDLLTLGDRELMHLRRHKMGMVFQHFALLPHLSVIENVMFPLEIQGMPKVKRHARAREVIELVGLQSRESYYPRELSGGQQQRVGIARSLAVEPDIWFLDEPFSALDPLIRREMQDEFIRLQDALQKTIVFITHDFDEAIRLADRIAIMNHGEIVQIGTPEELVLDPRTDYVAEFTRDIPRAKVLSVSAVARPLDGSVLSTLDAVDASATIADIAPHVVHQSQPIGVLDTAGTITRALHPSDVLDILAGTATSTESRVT